MTNTDENMGELQPQEVVQEVAEITREYSSQADYVARVLANVDERSQRVQEALEEAFKSVIQMKMLEVIDFKVLSVQDLGHALEQFPMILKPLLTVCNVAGRALERD